MRRPQIPEGIHLHLDVRQLLSAYNQQARFVALVANSCYLRLHELQQHPVDHPACIWK